MQTKTKQNKKEPDLLLEKVKISQFTLTASKGLYFHSIHLFMESVPFLCHSHRTQIKHVPVSWRCRRKSWRVFGLRLSSSGILTYFSFSVPHC